MIGVGLLEYVSDCRHKVDPARYKQRHGEDITTQVIHRNSAFRSVEEGIRFFSDPKNGTGGVFPYHFHIGLNSVIHWILPVDCVGPAAMSLNKCGVQISIEGDFRKYPPTAAQYDKLKLLCGYLYDKGLHVIVGHTDVKGASADENKVCPGQYLDTKKLLSDIISERNTNGYKL